MAYPILFKYLTHLPEGEWHTPSVVAEDTAHETADVATVLNAMNRSLLGYDLKLEKKDGEIERFQIRKL